MAAFEKPGHRNHDHSYTGGIRGRIHDDALHKLRISIDIGRRSQAVPVTPRVRVRTGRFIIVDSRGLKPRFKKKERKWPSGVEEWAGFIEGRQG